MRQCTALFAVLLALIAFGPIQSMAKGPGNSGNSGNSGNNSSMGNSSNNGMNMGNSMNNMGNGMNNMMGNGMQNSDKQKSGNSGKDFKSGNSGNNFKNGLNNGNSMSDSMKSQKNFDSKNRPQFTDSKEGSDSSRYKWENGRWWFWGPGSWWLWYGDDGRWHDYRNEYVVNRPILENYSGGPIKIVNPTKNGVTLNYLLDGNTYSIRPGYSQDLSEDRAWTIQFSRGENMDQARYGLRSGVYTFAHTDHGWELYRTDFPQAVTTDAPTIAPANPSMAMPANPPMPTPANP